MIKSLGETRAADVTPKSGVRNYDGVMDYMHMVAACQQRGSDIQVGHTGGEGDLVRGGLPTPGANDGSGVTRGPTVVWWKRQTGFRVNVSRRLPNDCGS